MRKMLYSLLLPFLSFSLCGSLLGCSGSPERSDLPDDDATAIFTKRPQPELVMESPVPQAGGQEAARSVVVNQALVVFDEGVTTGDIAQTLSLMCDDLASVALAVVGQIPDVRMYQLEIANEEPDPAAAIARLDSTIEALRGYAGVQSVAYNELLADRVGDHDDDNDRYERHERCALASVDYFQMVPIADELFESVALSDVTVAIIDSGLWVESGQFDEILPRTQFPDQPPSNPTPWDRHPRNHGTSVASIIAADNGDGIANGIALRLLGERLHLIVGDAYLYVGNQYSMAEVVASARRAIDHGAQIVNLSVGRHAGGDRPEWLTTLQDEFRTLFRSAPDVLFVAAASNDAFELDHNDAPAGIGEPNLLTVGGLSSCDLDEIYLRSSTGPGVEIAAPATDIPVCCLGETMTGPLPNTMTGNSVATPIVTSVAAVVQAIDPTLRGAALKQFLLDETHSWPGPSTVGGRRTALIIAAGSALLEREGGAGVDVVMDAYNGGADAVVDPSGHMINRLRGEIDFTVAGPQYEATHHLTGSDLAFFSPAGASHTALNFGLIGNYMVMLSMAQGGDTVQVWATSGFRLDEEYAVYPGGANGIAIHAGAAGGGDYNGHEGLTGSFTFTECELTTRSLPLDWFSPDRSGPHQLVFIEVAGTLNGTVNGFTESGGTLATDVVYSANGSFTTAFSLIDVDAPTLEYLEEACVGGYRHAVP